MDVPPAPSTNSTLDTMVFSSTMMPQSVHTEEPDGPSDSMARDPQLGQQSTFGFRDDDATLPPAAAAEGAPPAAAEVALDSLAVASSASVAPPSSPLAASGSSASSQKLSSSDQRDMVGGWLERFVLWCVGLR